MRVNMNIGFNKYTRYKMLNIFHYFGLDNNISGVSIDAFAYKLDFSFITFARITRKSKLHFLIFFNSMPIFFKYFKFNMNILGIYNSSDIFFRTDILPEMYVQLFYHP